MQKKIIAILIISNLILFVLMWAFKEKFESKKIEAADYAIFLKQEKEERFKDKAGYEHLRKEVEAIGDATSLKNSPEWMALISEVKGLKAKNVLVGNQISMKSEYFVNTTIKDSIINDTVHIKCIKPYKDKFISLSGCDGNFSIVSSDSISQIVYNGKRTKKFLFFRVGPRSVESELINYNPNSTFTYNKIVVIKKKK